MEEDNEFLKDFIKQMLGNNFKSGFSSMISIGGNGTNTNNLFDFPKDDDPNYTKIVETLETSTHVIKKEVWTSIVDNQRLERTTHESKGADKKSGPTIKELEVQKLDAIKAQNYEEAARLRDLIKNHKK